MIIYPTKRSPGPKAEANADQQGEKKPAAMETLGNEVAADISGSLIFIAPVQLLTLFGSTALSMARIAGTAFGGFRNRCFCLCRQGSAAQIGPVDIGTKFFAANATARRLFDRRAALSRDWSCSIFPLGNK